MLTNAYLLRKIGADTAETEQHFAEIFRKIFLKGILPTGGPASDSRCPGARDHRKVGRFSWKEA